MCLRRWGCGWRCLVLLLLLLLAHFKQVFALWMRLHAFLGYLQSGHDPDKAHYTFLYFQMMCLLVITINIFRYAPAEECPQGKSQCVIIAGADAGYGLFFAHLGITLAYGIVCDPRLLF